MINIIVDEKRGAELKTGRLTDSGYDVRCIGYSKVTPIFEKIYGMNVKVDGKIEAPTYFADEKEEFVIVMPNEQIMLITGVYVELPKGYQIDDNEFELMEIQVRPRSGMSIKMGLNVHLGTVDNEYRGSCNVLATNTSIYPIKIGFGERIGQLVFNEIIKIKDEGFNKVNTFISETDRGAKGYGSSGK